MKEKNIKEENIKVTVLLPSLNVVDYIEQCLHSVVNQTLNEIEILCIDAGSTDGTLEVIRNFSEKDSRIKLIHSDMKSYGYQMNLGIREASGDYIGIVETDDYIENHMYEILYKEALKHNADVAKSMLYEVYESKGGRSIEIAIRYIPPDYCTGRAFIPDEDPSVHAWDGNIWNGIYRRDFLIDKDIRFSETQGAAFQDIGFQQKVLNEAESIVYTTNHFYHYRKTRPGASTWNPKSLQYIYVEYKNLFENTSLKSNHKRYIYKRLGPAFIYEFKKALCYCDFRLDRLECPKALEWFENTMRNAFATGEFEPLDYNDANRTMVLEFLTDRKAFVNNYQRSIQKIERFVVDLERVRGNRGLILFGAGHYGLMLLLFLIKNGIEIDAIADNNHRLHNTRYYNIPVLSGDDVICKYSDAYFLITSKKNGDAIKKQMIRQGIQEEQIDIFDSEDQRMISELQRTPILVREGKIET